MRRVYRYAAGKADWLAAGLPVEGTDADRPRAATLARPDVATCRPSDQLGQAQERLSAGHWPVCVVLDPQRIVLGAVSGLLGADPRRPVDEVMEPAPDTVRPAAPPAEILEHMGGDEDDEYILVTTSDGGLIGLAFRADVEECLRNDPGPAPRPTPAPEAMERRAA